MIEDCAKVPIRESCCSRDEMKQRRGRVVQWMHDPNTCKCGQSYRYQKMLYDTHEHDRLTARYHLAKRLGLWQHIKSYTRASNVDGL